MCKFRGYETKELFGLGIQYLQTTGQVREGVYQVGGAQDRNQYCMQSAVHWQKPEV